MTLTNNEAVRLAKEEMAKHGLTASGWTFRLNTNRSRLGVCKFAKTRKYRNIGMAFPITERIDIKRIEISVYCVATGYATFMDTLLHEIAHALAGPAAKHGPVWKAKAREIGCTAMRCGSMDAPARYIGTCPKCKIVIKANRNTRGMARKYHPACGASPARGEFIQWNHLPHITTPIVQPPKLTPLFVWDNPLLNR